MFRERANQECLAIAESRFKSYPKHFLLSTYRKVFYVNQRTASAPSVILEYFAM